jgi:phage virion morphogenesis protein
MADVLSMTADRPALARLFSQLDVLRLSPQDKRRLVKEMAMEVRRQSRKNIREQRCVDGRPMAPRKLEGRKGKVTRRKMLVGLGRMMSIEASRVGSGQVSWANSYTARIADRHQHGKDEQFRTSGRKRREKDSDYYQPDARVERWLAKELLRLGYRTEVKLPNGKVRRQRVNQRWIMKHMTRAEAVAIWHELSGRTPDDTWTIGVPARPFLGVNGRQSATMLDDLAQASLVKLRRKGKI